MSAVQVVVLALIQGVTEFLPISSTAHLVLPAALTDWPDQGLAFDVAVHLGTLMAALVYFRREFTGFAVSGAAFVRTRERDENFDLLLKILLATLPIAVAGVLFKEQIEANLRATTLIAISTIVFGIALWWADRRVAPDHGRMPSFGEALLIGCVQTAALIPGASRAGVTVTAALLLGLGRAHAVRFAFLLATPAIAGAALLSGLDTTHGTSWTDLGIGFAVAALSAFVCIGTLIRFVERIGMAPFAVYRVVLGVLLLTLL